MMKNGCIHPAIMQAISLCGHGDKILIADGNYPIASKTGATSQKVYLGLRAGIPTVTETLETLLEEIVVEDAAVMEPGSGEAPAIYQEFAQRLPGITLKRLDRYRFYDSCGEPCVRLVISTGEKRTFANILLTVGVA